MTLVIQSSSPSSSSSVQYCISNRSMPPSPVHDGLYQQPPVHLSPTSLINHPNTALEPIPLQQRFYLEDTEEERGGERKGSRWFEEDADGGSVLALFVSQLRRSVFGRASLSEDSSSMNPISSYSSSCSDMEIGVPTNVRHVAHVTFDRFNGFLGLPLEFEPEVPRRPPSASTTVFGVSTNSMQLSFDSRGNSVPTILLMMQRRLYTLGGLEVEGIFRITAGSDQEEYVRQQLNRGVVPEDADVHCLAGLIKTWFRELPTGILDCLSPELLKESQTEDECGDLTRHLPPTEAALLDWTVNLMADIAQLEHLNKMNAHNVAVVFAPNMTRVLDPLTALMHAVQVMNFLKTLIARTLRKREGSALDQDTSKYSWDKNDTCGPSQTILEENNETDYKVHTHRDSITLENPHDLERHLPQLRDDNDSITEDCQVQSPVFLNFIENVIPRGCDNHYPFVVSDKMNQKGGGAGGDDGVTTSGSQGIGTDHTRESSPGNYKSCNVDRIRNKQSSWEVFLNQKERPPNGDDRNKLPTVPRAENVKGTNRHCWSDESSSLGG